MEQLIPVFGARSETLPIKTRACAYAVVTKAEGLVAAVHESHGLHLPGGGIEPSETPAEAVHREVREELGCRVILGERIGHDFSQYKTATLTRRIRRRMQAQGIATVPDLLRVLRLADGAPLLVVLRLLVSAPRGRQAATLP